MKCFVSLDGLSIEDLQDVLEFLPKSSSALSSSVLYELTSAFADCQAIWAQLLTGEPWSKNGCSGYSRPVDSISRLAVFTERDLLKPLRLLETSKLAPAVAINVPLLRPSPEDRSWLSDGSLPINRTVSPTSLLSEDVFAAYKPRAAISLLGAEESNEELGEKWLNIETNRLECALRLFERSSVECAFLYRISAFDCLSHLFGINFLKERDLRISRALTRFLGRLDDAIDSFRSRCGRNLFLFSAFSHVPCRASVNLNSVLQRGKFLKSDPGGGSLRGQRQRASVVLGSESSSSQLTATEGRAAVDETLAYSPTAGSIYINSRRQFADGNVTDPQYDQIRSSVRNFLNTELREKFGDRFSFQEYPSDVPDSLDAPIPEFMVNIDGCELQNTETSNSPWGSTPRTTHFRQGFALLPGCSKTPSSLLSYEFIDAVNASMAG